MRAVEAAAPELEGLSYDERTLRLSELRGKKHIAFPLLTERQKRSRSAGTAR